MRIALLGLFAASLFAQELSYDSVANFIKMPEHIYMGEAAGVATDSKGNVYVYTRTGADNATMAGSRVFTHGGSRLFVFDSNGKYLREMGVGVYGFLVAQAVRIDAQDNVWVVDRGGNQVIKFDPQGRIAMVMGRKPEAINPGGGRGPAPAAAGGRGSAEGRGAAAPPPVEAVVARWARAFGATASIVRLTSPSMPLATSSSPTATAMLASPSSRRTERSSSPGAPKARRTASSIRRTASLSMLRATSTSPTAATSASRSSITMAVFKTQFANVGSPWAICVSRGAHSVPVQSQTPTNRTRWIVARFTNWSWMGAWSAGSKSEAAEGIRHGTTTAVTTLPSGSLISSNLAVGSATVTVNAGGQTIATFLDTTLFPSCQAPHRLSANLQSQWGRALPSERPSPSASRETLPTVLLGPAPGGSCSAPLVMPVGAAFIAETASPGTVMTSVTTLPAGLLVSNNLSAGTATVTHRECRGAEFIATFVNTVISAIPLGTLEVCKLGGAGVTSGMSFSFNVGGTPVTVLAGSCVAAAAFPVGTSIVVAEIPSAGTTVSAIRVLPPDTARALMTLTWRHSRCEHRNGPNRGGLHKHSGRARPTEGM